MNRRHFLRSSLAAGALAGISSTTSIYAADADSKGPREFYELRLYHFGSAAKQKVFDAYAAKAAIPAMNRLRIGPIGVFTPTAPSESPTVYVLIPYKSSEEFVTMSAQLGADAEYLKAGAEFINAPATDPAFTRVESSFMRAFEGMPKVEVPIGVKQGRPRLLELRTYESHSKKANKKKIEMFNVGEIAIFRRAGLQPVFFGETLVGAQLPNLTYMLVFDDMAAHDKNWSAFVADPEWKKLSTTPGYTDKEIVSHITRTFLSPTAYSQL